MNGFNKIFTHDNPIISMLRSCCLKVMVFSDPSNEIVVDEACKYLI